MYLRNNQKEKQSYTNLMDGIKELNYEIDLLEKRVKVLQKPQNSIIDWIKRKTKRKPEIRESNIQAKKCNYFLEERVAIYTCIIGGYDQLYEPLFVPDNCDFFVITNQLVSEDSCWKKIDPEPYVDSCLNEIQKKNNISVSRFFKMLPFEVFTDYRYSIYIDANFKIYTDLTEYIHKINPIYGVGFFTHEDRKCVYDEIQRCAQLGKDTPENLDKCADCLHNWGMPYNYGLLAGGLIVRDHHNDKTVFLMREWWQEYNKLSSCRDQISLPYILYKNKVKPQEVGTLGQNYKEELAFRRVPHKKSDTA